MEKIDEKHYKIRKSGNSDVTTVPQEVKTALGVQTGDSISYIFDENGTIRIKKAEKKIDVDTIVDTVMEEYEAALKDLVDL